jgi:gamma-glutamyltranspeptidase
MEDPWPLGGGQLIVVDSASGSLTGAADPRLDGCALGF